MTYKGPRVTGTGVKSRPEIEVTVEDADAAQQVLEALGYRKVFRYQKYREAFRWRDAEIVVDETPIGTFLEVEGPIETIHAAAAALGRGPADYVEESYAALFLASGRSGDMVFREGDGIDRAALRAYPRPLTGTRGEAHETSARGPCPAGRAERRSARRRRCRRRC